MRARRYKSQLGPGRLHGSRPLTAPGCGSSSQGFMAEAHLDKIRLRGMGFGTLGFRVPSLCQSSSFKAETQQINAKEY